MGLLDKIFGRQKKKPDAWQVPVVQEICVALIDILPPDWNTVVLTLDVSAQGLGHGLAHNIKSPEGRPDVVLPTPEVFTATRKLELGWAERNSTFKRAIISAHRNGEDWSIRSDYER